MIPRLNEGEFILEEWVLPQEDRPKFASQPSPAENPQPQPNVISLDQYRRDRRKKAAPPL
jgi:hypothetical protein